MALLGIYNDLNFQIIILKTCLYLFRFLHYRQSNALQMLTDGLKTVFDYMLLCMLVSF